MIDVRSAPDGLLLAGAAALVLISTGCANDVGMGVLPQDNMTVSLMNDIQPLFSMKYACTSCHTGSFAAANLRLGPGDSHSNLVNQPSCETTAKLRVEPFASGRSYLVDKILGSQGGVGGCVQCVSPPPWPTVSDCGLRMPREPCAPCEVEGDDITLIRRWIDQGAENN